MAEDIPEASLPVPERKRRHPLVAWVIGTLRIMWFAVRHPGKPAWIDHRTGEVWAAE